MAKTTIRNVYTTLVLFLIAVILGLLAFSFTAKNLISNANFYNVYSILGIISLFYLAIAAFYRLFADEDITNAFFIMDNEEERILGNPMAILTIAVGLMIIFGGYVILTGQSVINPPNPYTSETLSKSVLDEHSFLVNFFAVALVPGVFEEAVIFGLICISNYIVLRFVANPVFDEEDLQNNAWAILIVSLFTISIFSFVFANAHGQAYGDNKEAFISAFVFEFIVQFANQLTGAFISWLPHVTHNTSVIFSTQLSFSIGGAAAIMLVIPSSRKFLTKLVSARKNKLAQDWLAIKRCVS